ncbi:Clavaminate synthase-like protein [Clavulina sp. PMI_390]|nr:Clavaminate synthase-like protein [Clavulina sp. PMI_390]
MLDLVRIARDYQGLTQKINLNGTTVEHWNRAPTPLEFSRLVNIAHDALPNILARERWSEQYLLDTMGDSLISVAVTPDGNADAVTHHPADGKQYFVEPCIERMTMRELLNNINDAGDVSKSSANEICYLQSQNGNLFTPKDPSHCTNEFIPIRDDVPADIAWATEALAQPPDAVNVWIGDERSRTSIHSDPYENIYTVIRGSKLFILLPPTEGFLLSEREYPRATYERLDGTEGAGALQLVPCVPEGPPVRTENKDNKDAERAFREHARPIYVTLREGETLYLPSGWWHHVSQSCSSNTQSEDSKQEGRACIALNWWYDMEMRGDRWVWLSTLRRAAKENSSLK